jgi:hypothetical protein
MSLKPQTLDIIIRRITDHTVFYDLTLTGKEESWEIPTNSSFDRSQLRVGTRYKVLSNVILATVRKTKRVGKKFYKTDKYEKIERYDWASVTPLASYIPSQARTKKQTQAAHQAGRLELVDDGLLFDWHPGK